jgi:hypothetical protein
MQSGNPQRSGGERRLMTHSGQVVSGGIINRTPTPVALGVNQDQTIGESMQLV